MKKTYFNHDSAARNDYRIIKLRATLGYEGYGVFWAVLELLFTEENKICTINGRWLLATIFYRK